MHWLRRKKFTDIWRAKLPWKIRFFDLKKTVRNSEQKMFFKISLLFRCLWTFFYATDEHFQGMQKVPLDRIFTLGITGKWEPYDTPSKDIHEKRKNQFLKQSTSKTGYKNVKRSIFQGKFALQMSLKFFLRNQYICSRFVEGVPESYLYVYKQIGTVRHTNQEISGK